MKENIFLPGWRCFSLTKLRNCCHDNFLSFCYHRTSVAVWHKWKHSIWDPTFQRVPVCHWEKRGDSGVPPERRHRDLPHGSPLLCPTQPDRWKTRPSWGREIFSPSFAYFDSLFHILCIQMLNSPQAFAQNVLSKADVIQATGDAVCIFKELQCLTPRGR